MFVIRGRLCPICKIYLGEIKKRRAVPAELRVSLVAVSADGALQLVDAAIAPFLRPDLDWLVGGLRFVIEKGSPIRGTLD